MNPILLLCPLITILCIMNLFLPGTLSQDPAAQEPQLLSMMNDIVSLQGNKTTLRTQFLLSGCIIRGYPSQGGIIIGFVTAAELEWLGLSRSQSSQISPDSTEEDKFCFKILRLGARWWRSETLFDHRSSQVEGGYPWTGVYPPSLHVAYPSTGDGVYVLKLPSSQDVPDEFGKVEMAFAMDERCDAPLAVGATFYETTGECEDVAVSLGDGIAMGRR